MIYFLQGILSEDDDCKFILTLTNCKQLEFDAADAAVFPVDW